MALIYDYHVQQMSQRWLIGTWMLLFLWQVLNACKLLPHCTYVLYIAPTIIVVIGAVSEWLLCCLLKLNILPPKE